MTHCVSISTFFLHTYRDTNDRQKRDRAIKTLERLSKEEQTALEYFENANIPVERPNMDGMVWIILKILI